MPLVHILFTLQKMCQFNFFFYAPFSHLNFSLVFICYFVYIFFFSRILTAHWLLFCISLILFESLKSDHNWIQTTYIIGKLPLITNHPITIHHHLWHHWVLTMIDCQSPCWSMTTFNYWWGNWILADWKLVKVIYCKSII